MHIKRGKYKHNKKNEEVELIEIGHWEDGQETRAIAIYNSLTFDLTYCSYLDDFKKNYTYKE